MNKDKTQGALYIVATPIGNVEDISSRAIKVLSEVELIACEDTRYARKLLSALGIRTKLMSYFEANERERTATLMQYLRRGAHLALVSDAGTPLISDPGYPLVRAAQEADISVIAIPGPSALTAALSIAGLPTDRFVFEGFLSSKAIARRRQLEVLKNESGTLLFFEAPHRLSAMLIDVATVFGADREVVIARELTKKFETLYKGSAAVLAARSGTDPDMVRGELVVMVAGAAVATMPVKVDMDKLLGSLVRELGVAQGSKIVAEATGQSKRSIYQKMLALQNPASSSN